MTLRLRTPPATQKGLAASNRKHAQSEGGDPPSERSYFLHKLILFQSPYFENRLKYQAEGSLGKKPCETPPKKSQKRLPCSTPTDPSSSAADAASSASSELVEHVEECEVEAMELLLKSMYKADPDLPKEARGDGQLLLQVRSKGWKR